MQQRLGLMLQRLRRRGRLFHQRSILLGHLVHLVDRGIDLAEPGGAKDLLDIAAVDAQHGDVEAGGVLLDQLGATLFLRSKSGAALTPCSANSTT